MLTQNSWFETFARLIFLELKNMVNKFYQCQNHTLLLLFHIPSVKVLIVLLIDMSIRHFVSSLSKYLK